MSDGRDVRSCKVDVEKKKNHMLKRCESVGGSKKSEIKMGEGGQGGKPQEKVAIESCAHEYM